MNETNPSPCLETREGRALLTAGYLDTTFGAAGVFATAIGTCAGVPFTAAVQLADGKVVEVVYSTRPFLIPVAFGLEGRLVAVAGAALAGGSTVILHDAESGFATTDAAENQEQGARPLTRDPSD
jgi:hypothetical protein